MSLMRLGVVPLFLACIHGYTPERAELRHAALFLYIAAALTDMLDGYVARRFHEESRLGKRLDPLADKLLVNLGFVFVAANAAFSPGVPLWVPVVFLVRDAYIVLGAKVINERYGPFQVTPRLSGKATTALQMAAMIAVLLANPAAPALLAGAVLGCVWSAADYYVAGMRQVRARQGIR